ncbi:hypothetical protein [Dictyobacter kobayashii]|uniref:Uncharacterized protein n=1 Tax=Dictyobacter kobayashii TaxID=2014872 RepID=A0A402AWL2_9CHLR|nr:hypothetical protein [Dictyobacter kobayashii]GCE23468.1 hypothetical protein KDK_72680 [Dictyobacter kobayashii]
MLFELFFFLGLQAIFIIINLSIGMIGFIRSQQVWKETLTAPRHDTQPINDFLSFIARRNAAFRQSNILNTLVLILGMGLLGIGFLQLPDLFIHGPIVVINDSDSLTLANLYLIVFLVIFFSPLLGLSIGGNIAILLTNIFVDARAVEFFHISTLSRQEFTRQRLFFILNAALPLIIFAEVTGLIATATGQFIPAFIVILIFVIAIACIRVFFGRKLLKATRFLQPIEQTRWAHLQPRITAWSRLAGIEFREVLIQPDALGTNILIMGRQRPTLIIGDWILQYTDWRQQDAMFCIELALAKKKVLTWRYWHRFSVLMGLALIILVPILLLISGVQLDLLLLPLLIFAMLLVFIFINRSFGKKMHTLYLDSDCIACYFTGDPMATMVALSTLQALNGVRSTQKSAVIPSANTRLQQLDQLARQPWPRAPFASELVPAITPVTFGPYQLSKAFEQQSEPAPVPAPPMSH